MKRPTPKQIEGLRTFVKFTCEECKRHEDIVGKLTPHRINRGYLGGAYVLRNIKMICNYPGLIDGKKSCHKIFHQGEFHG